MSNGIDVGLGKQCFHYMWEKKEKKSKRATTGKTETEMLNEAEIKHHCGPKT